MNHGRSRFWRTLWINEDSGRIVMSNLEDIEHRDSYSLHCVKCHPQNPAMVMNRAESYWKFTLHLIESETMFSVESIRRNGLALHRAM